MAQDNKITMPSGQGGLTRYFEETNAKIELSPASIIIISIVIVIIIFSIIILEGVNTVLERIIDLVEPRYKDMVGEIKDALAGLVMLASVGAVLIGLLIFWPYIQSILNIV